jgi:hypothetical protein
LTVAFPNGTGQNDPNAFHHIQKVNQEINKHIVKEINIAASIGSAGDLISQVQNLIGNFFHEPLLPVKTGVFQILNTNIAAPIPGATVSAANVNFWNEGIFPNQGPNPVFQHAKTAIEKLNKNIDQLFNLAGNKNLKKIEKKSIEQISNKTEKEIHKVEKKLDKAEKKLDQNEAKIQNLLSNPSVDANTKATLKYSLNEIKESKNVIQNSKAQLQEQKRRISKF